MTSPMEPVGMPPLPGDVEQQKTTKPEQQKQPKSAEELQRIEEYRKNLAEQRAKRAAAESTQQSQAVAEQLAEISPNQKEATLKASGKMKGGLFGLFGEKMERELHVTSYGETQGQRDHDPNCKKTMNEDWIVHDPESGVGIVADGLGGIKGGGDASRKAAPIVHERLQQIPTFVDADAASEQMKQAMIDACAQLQGEQGSTTLVASKLIVDRKTGKTMALISHVGDSPAFVVRADGSMERLTEDHNILFVVKQSLATQNKAEFDQYAAAVGRNAKQLPFKPEALPLVTNRIWEGSQNNPQYLQQEYDRIKVQMQAKENVVPEDQALYYYYRLCNSAMFTALGAGQLDLVKKVVAVKQVEMHSGDMILLASDGISDNLTDEQLAERAKKNPKANLAKQLTDESVAQWKNKLSANAKPDDASTVTMKVSF